MMPTSGKTTSLVPCLISSIRSGAKEIIEIKSTERKAENPVEATFLLELFLISPRTKDELIQFKREKMTSEFPFTTVPREEHGQEYPQYCSILQKVIDLMSTGDVMFDQKTHMFQLTKEGFDSIFQNNKTESNQPDLILLQGEII